MATSKEKLQIIVDAQGIAKTKAQLKGMDKATGGATKSFGLMAAGIAGATVALYALGKATSFAIRVGKDFEQGMANVKAISGATGAEFKALEANAKLLGRTTKFTATEISNLQTEFAKLGFTSTEINKVTKGTLALAAATGSDLAVSAEVAGATLRGFGLDASETGKVTDVMAKSFSSSALDMTKFSESMKFVAPVAKMAGFQIEGTTAILGQLANAGLHGSMAGTALRSIFLKLADTNSSLSKRLGGSVNSVEELIPALNQLKDEGVDLTEMLELTDKRAVTAFGVLLDGSDDVNILAESLRNAGGAAQEMADIQLDTLEGKMIIMNSAMEGLGIAIGDKLSPAIQGAVEGFTSLLGTMTDIITKGDQAFHKFEDMSDAVSQAQINATQTRAEFKNLTGQLLHLARQTKLSTYEEERRNGIIDELQEKYPNYLANLDQEADDYMALSRQIASASKSLDEYLKKQMNVAIAKQFSDKTAEINIKLVELEQTLAQLEDPMTHLFIKSGEDAGGFLGFIGLGEEGFKDQAGAVSGVKREIENLELELGNIMVLYEQATIKSQTFSDVPPPSTNLIQFEEEQGPPLPPSIGPTDEEFAEAQQKLIEFYSAQQNIRIVAAQMKLAEEERNINKHLDTIEAGGELRKQTEQYFIDARKALSEEEGMDRLETLSQYDNDIKIQLLEQQKQFALAELIALEASEEAKLNLIKEYDDQIKEVKESSNKFSLQNITEATTATLGVVGNVFGQMASIKQKDLEIEKKRLKELGHSEDEISVMQEGKLKELQETRYRQAQFAAFEAAINAYNSMVGVPIVGPVLGPIAGASALVFGLQQAEQIKQAEQGGLLVGPSHTGGGIPIEAEGGEFIMRREAVAKLGVPFMDALNRGDKEVVRERIEKFEKGGLVQEYHNSVKERFEKGGLVTNNTIQRFEKGGMVTNDIFKEGGLVTNEKFREGGLIERFKEGGLVTNNTIERFQEGGAVPVDSEQPINITLNISAPLVDDTVIDTIIPAIRSAIKRGEDIGI